LGRQRRMQAWSLTNHIMWKGLTSRRRWGEEKWCWQLVVVIVAAAAAVNLCLKYNHINTSSEQMHL
jgi:hypothetical protein